jgi:hypothetical protein
MSLIDKYFYLRKAHSTKHLKSASYLMTGNCCTERQQLVTNYYNNFTQVHMPTTGNRFSKEQTHKGTSALPDEICCHGIHISEHD